MRVDFYQLSRDPVEAVLPQIARATLRGGNRLLVVSGDDSQIDRIDRALWEKFPETFLGHGRAGGEHDARQPVLLGGQMQAGNGSKYVAIADGVWRDADSDFDRTFYFFDDATLKPARQCWRELGKRDGLERHFWKQEGGKWIEAG